MRAESAEGIEVSMTSSSRRATQQAKWQFPGLERYCKGTRQYKTGAAHSGLRSGHQARGFYRHYRYGSLSFAQ